MSTDRNTIVGNAIAIIGREQQMFPNNPWCIPELRANSNTRFNFHRICNNVYRILEVARSSQVLCLSPNTKDVLAPKSVAAHTNLMCAILDVVLNLTFSEKIDNATFYGHIYREVMEAARRHDLHKNVTGDIADNDERCGEDIAAKKDHYRREYSTEYSIISEQIFEKKVSELLQEMEEKNTPLGRILYLSDVISDIVMDLSYDQAGHPPIISAQNKHTTINEKIAMSFCDYRRNGSRKMSEMRTIDYLKVRKIAKYDDAGYFTTILVMATLIVNGKWYSWRRRDYNSLFSHKAK